MISQPKNLNGAVERCATFQRNNAHLADGAGRFVLLEPQREFIFDARTFRRAR